MNSLHSQQVELPPSFTSDSETPSGSATLSRAPTPAASAPALVPTEELFKQFMTIYIDLVQNPSPIHTEPRERPLKTRFPKLYFGKSHMDCYNFCQQCEDHFDTAQATVSNRTSFAALFLCGSINFRWTQYKRRHQSEEVAPISWSEFKAFLCKNLGDFQSFVDNIWSKFKKDSQYQLEEAQDWASHLEHLQSILLEFDADGAKEESDLIRFFWEELKSCIKAEMEQRGRELDNWEEIVEKAIGAKAKADLWPVSYVKDTDHRCLYGNRPAYTTAARVQTQVSSMRDPRTEDHKSRP